MFEMAFAIQNVNTTESGQRMMSGASSQSRISTSRLSGFALTGFGFFKAVAEAADGDDPHAPRLELPAQAVHVDLDRVGRHFLTPLAEVRDQLVLGDQAPGALQEDLEQAHLARRELERLAVQPRDASDLVVGERAVLEQRGASRHAPPNERPHPRLQLGKLERLGEI